MKNPDQSPGRRAARLLALTLLLVGLLSLTGCYCRREINSLAIVMAVGIDKGKDPENYLLTVQFANVSALKAASGGKNEGSKAYVMAHYEAPSISSCVEGINFRASRDLYFSHNQIILIGRELAEDNITPVLDYFTRDYENRLDTLIAVADNTSSEVLEEETEVEKLPALHLRDMIEMQEHAATSEAVSLRVFLINYISKTTAPVLPILSTFASEKDKTLAYVKGMAVFQDGKMIGELSPEESRGLLWLKGEVENGTADTWVLGGRLSFQFLSSLASVEPIYKNGQFAIDVQVHSSLGIVEAVTDENLMDIDNLELLNATGQDLITKEIQATISKAKLLKADIFGFGDLLHQKYPNEAKSLLENWDEVFPNLEINVHVETDVRSSGSIGSPIIPGGPE